MRRPIVALGLGSNVGPAIENLRKALSALKQCVFLEILNVSSIYESEALLPPDATENWNIPFLNAVVLCRLSTEVNPENILNEIKRIEADLGRQPAEKWAPRIIDIDILWWSESDYKSKTLNIPHAELSARPFALLPLLEVTQVTNLQLPVWANDWVSLKPFSTKKSRNVFWPKMVGILNITNDSFSDGGIFLEEESLHRQFNLLIDQGAEIIDIGAESTRPGAVAISHADEFKNLNWALGEIRKVNYHVKLSLDCRNPSVAKRVMENYKIEYLNDVTGFDSAEMRLLLKESGVNAFVMHSLGVPPSIDNTLGDEINPCTQLIDWWRLKRHQLSESGIAVEKIIFDPGIGFGKSKQQSLYILRHLKELSAIKEDIMIGHSRKSFQTLYSSRPASERDLETALVTQGLNLAYAQYLRLHNIESQKIALRAKI